MCIPSIVLHHRCKLGWVYVVGNAERNGNATGNPNSNVVTGSHIEGCLVGLPRLAATWGRLFGCCQATREVFAWAAGPQPQ
nr:hypothetical protein [Tanacetum cinerariifolium]